MNYKTNDETTCESFLRDFASLHEPSPALCVQRTTRSKLPEYNRPIIALTAHAMAEHRQQCLDAGCDDFASKPIDRKNLLAIIKKFSSEESTMSIPQSSSDVLVSELAGDDDMLELIEMFVTDLPTGIAEIEQAIGRRDVSEVAKLAHQLKGPAGGYGFPTITDAADLLEASVMAGDALEAVERHVSTLRELCGRVRGRTISVLLNGTPG